MILFMVEMSFIALSGSGLTQTSAVDNLRRARVVRILPVKVT